MSSDERARWEALVPEKQRDRPAFAFVEDVPGLPRVLLIGDSISIGYTPTVRRLLEGKANVHRVYSNCAHTNVGLEELDDWLGTRPWDVIHFNWGLHDIKRLDEDGKLDLNGNLISTMELYHGNLNTLVARLKETGAELVWAATTPVPEDAAGRMPGDDVKYNALAAEVMGRHRVAVNDLHAAVLPRLDTLQQPANVHFTPEGSEFLGAEAAKAILDALERRG